MRSVLFMIGAKRVEDPAWKQHEMEVAGKLPDFADPVVAKELRCSACAAMVKEVGTFLFHFV